MQASLCLMQNMMKLMKHLEAQTISSKQFVSILNDSPHTLSRVPEDLIHSPLHPHAHESSEVAGGMTHCHIASASVVFPVANNCASVSECGASWWSCPTRDAQR